MWLVFEAVAPIRFQLNSGPIGVRVLRWTILTVSVAVVGAGIYAFTNHTFARHYTLLLLLTSGLLGGFSAIVSARQSKT